MPTVKRPVISDADRSAARALADEAFEALDAGQNERAEQLFSQALQRADVPTLRVGRADARLKLNRWVEAQQDYQSAVDFPLLATDPVPFREAQVVAAEHLEQLKKSMPRLLLTSDDMSATFTIDGGASQSVNGSTELSINPGRHWLALAAGGRTETREVEALEGERVELEAAKLYPTPGGWIPENLAVVDEARPPTPITPSGGTRTNDTPVDHNGAVSDNVVVSGAVTGALAVGAVVTGIIFWNERADSQDEGLPFPEQDDSYNTAFTMRWVSTALTAAAVVGAGVTTYLWLAPAPEYQQEAAAQRAELADTLRLPTGVVIGAGGRF